MRIAKITSEPRRLVIGIEASTPASGVALADAGGRLLAHHWSDSPVPASERLLADLDRMLREFSVKPEEIEAVAVAVGPGAFTGLRVGLAQAKTLAQAWGARLYGFSTLAAAAHRWPVAGEAVCVALDARRGEVYTGIYQVAHEAPPAVLRTDRVEIISDLIESFARIDAPAIHFSGSGSRKYHAEIEEALGKRARWIAAPLDSPAADSLALLGAHLLREDQPGLDPLSAGPIYLRASDAEKRHGIDAGIPATEPSVP